MEAEDRPAAVEAPQAGEQEPVPGSRPKGSRQRSIIIFVCVSLVNIGLLAFLWTQLLTPAQNSTGYRDPLIGHPAPNFTLAALSKRPASMISLESFKGKPVVLNVWNSTCEPCIDEAPLLQQEWKLARSQGIVFIGIDFQDAKSEGLSFLRKYGITYPNVLDATGATAVSYGVTGTPETIFINRQGIVVSRATGELTAQTLQRNLQLIVH